MENRFGFRDFIFVILLVAIIVMIFLKMVQDNRHMDELAKISDRLVGQTRDLQANKELLDRIRAVLVAGAGSNATGNGGGGVDPDRAASLLSDDPYEFTETPQGDLFYGIKKAREHEDYARGDWFVDNFSAIPPKLNELTAQDVYSRVVYSRVMEPLCDYDIHHVKLTPLLAESWETAEDGMSTVFKIRKNITFSNGDPLTADDVVYTYEQTMNSNITDGRTREYYRNLVACEKIDDYTVRFRYGKVHYENFLRAASIKIHSREFLSEYSDEQIRQHPALLMGTGPYRLPDAKQYTPGEPITLMRNERYWGVPGPWERMIFNVIEKESTELIAFKNGELDLFAPLPEQHEQMLNDNSLVERTNHHVYEHIRTGYSYIAWNQKRVGETTVFADKRVRQAMTMLIDRERLVREVWLGYARVATGPFHHLGPQHNPDVEAWPYDPQRGVELLKTAGFSVRNDGRLIKPDGEPFDVELTYPSGSDFYTKIVLALKDNFARVGINLKQTPLKWPVLLEKLTNKDFDAITLGWGAGGIEGDIEQMFHTRTIKEGDNRNNYSNPELDRLIEKAHVTLDEEKRMAIWRQCHAILHEDQPYTFMFRPQVRLWLDKRIKNVQRIPVFGVNYVSTWSVPLEWYVPIEEQERGQ